MKSNHEKSKIIFSSCRCHDFSNFYVADDLYAIFNGFNGVNMKKIMILCILLLLGGCFKDPLVELGYDEEAISLIKSLEEDNQSFFTEEYRPQYVDMLKDENFVEENIDKYIEYYNYFEVDDLIYFINLGYSDNELNNISELIKDNYFLKNNVDLYLKYPKDEIRDTIEYVNTMRYKKDYEDVSEADYSRGIHILVNKYNYLPEDYEPTDLVTIDSEYGISGKLRQEAYEAYIAMYEAAVEDGLDFFITSPYRPYSSQYRIYNSYLETYSQEEVDTFSARPGFSEHQTGLAVDILTYDSNFDTFEYTDEAKWLAENAYRYGFILRYPEDKQDITGYKYEPWHYRYVGEIAQDVYESGLTYDEYYEYYFKD